MKFHISSAYTRTPPPRPTMPFPQTTLSTQGKTITDRREGTNIAQNTL